jgi:hypothetical protein
LAAGEAGADLAVGEVGAAAGEAVGAAGAADLVAGEAGEAVGAAGAAELAVGEAVGAAEPVAGEAEVGAAEQPMVLEDAPVEQGEVVAVGGKKPN